MRYRLLASVFAVCLVAMGQSLSVEKLVAFLHSSEKLTERLDDRTIEELQGSGNLGPKTLDALHALRERSQVLAAAKVLPPEPKPTPIPPPTSEEQAAV